MEEKQSTGSPIVWALIAIVSIIGGFIVSATWATDRGQDMSIGAFIASAVAAFVILAIAYLASIQQKEQDDDQAETNAAIRKHLKDQGK